MTMEKKRKITILGGGVAGLAAGFYAAREGRSFTVFEEAPRWGGNCVTFSHGEFRFDSGAHRLHDRDPGVTRLLKDLLGDGLAKISAPSQIWHRGRFIDFPLSPLNLLKAQGFTFCFRAGLEILASRLGGGRRQAEDFESLVVGTYGRTVASHFLLNYSEKLWGLPGSRLSPAIAATRLKGLDLKTFIVEALSGPKAKTEHLDGSFYYPRHGAGAITGALAEGCGEGNIRTGSPVTRVIHRGGRIEAVTVGEGERVEAGEVISTIPLTRLAGMMDPPPPGEVLEAAGALDYRSVILAALFLRRDGVTGNATVYFPDPEVPFSRVYEPRNRSRAMSPEGMTSLVAEYPCREKDPLWEAGDDELIGGLREQAAGIGWINGDEILGARVVRLRHAYPVLEKDFEDRLARVIAYLEEFSNLHLSGRNGLFSYSFIHDNIAVSRDIVLGMSGR
jgi:protoporphyrinogen oxidase